MRFSDAFLHDLRSRVTLSAYAGRRLAWDKRKSLPAKGEFWACCPFHTENSASFHIRDQQQSYYCFGCHAKGGVIDLAMQLEGLSFVEAVESLAGFAGMALPEREHRSDDQGLRKRLLDALRLAGELFRRALASEEGAPVRAYLLGRGLDSNLAERYGLGFAPAGWSVLTERLLREGFSLEELLKAGLAKQNEGRRPIDFFRNRLMIPITDAQDRIIAYGGRAMEKENPAKYLNSPETPLFDKGATLFRLAEARRRRAKGATLVVAEGYFDVIALEQAGLAAVAPLGTALTEAQLAQVWRASPEPVLCFDGDTAGQRAAGRALELAAPKLSPERTIRLALLPQGQDPDDILRAQGAQALAALVAGAQAAVDALFQRAVAEQPLDTPERKAGLRKRMRALCEMIQDPDTRALYQAAFHERLESVLGTARNTAPLPSRQQAKKRNGRGYVEQVLLSPELKRIAEAQREAGSPVRTRQLEDALRHALMLPEACVEGADLLAALECHDPDLDAIRHGVLDLLAQGRPVDQSTLVNHVTEMGFTSAAARAARWSTLKHGSGGASRQAQAEWLALLEQLVSEHDIAGQFRALPGDGRDDPEHALRLQLERAQQLAKARAESLQRALASRAEPKV